VLDYSVLSYLDKVKIFKAKTYVKLVPYVREAFCLNEVLSESNAQGEISLLRCKLESFCKNNYNGDSYFLFGSFRG
jgi:hypothetical protein